MKLICKVVIATLALIAPIAIYCSVRIYPPGLLSSFQTAHTIPVAQNGFFGSAPSFFFTLSIGVLVGSCASSLSSAKMHCFLWTTIALSLELSQHPTIAKPIATLLVDYLSASIGEFVRPYFLLGVFDHLDLLASVVGGIVAFLILHNMSTIRPLERLRSTTRRMNHAHYR